ncbi:MAG: tetratricopeptide repeat protein [Vampirovibrionales bacterium]|nr:tetratricopeptide repeat protein [Vampirovibrionales bacterium]
MRFKTRYSQACYFQALSIRARASRLILSGVLFAALGAGQSFNAAVALWPFKAKPAEQAQEALPTAQSSAQPERKIAAKALYNEGVDAFQLAQFQGSRGNGAGQSRLLNEAKKAFQKALKLNPALKEAQSNLGYVALAQNKPKQAIEAFNAAIAMDGAYLNAYNGLANAYMQLQQVDVAVETFQKLVALAPGNPDYGFNLGSALQHQQRFTEAQAAYEAVLKLEETHQKALFNLATLLQNQGQPDQALGYYERAKNAGVETPVGLEALRRIRALDEAVKDGASQDASLRTTED